MKKKYVKEKGKTKLIAHQGFAGVERGNTLPSFVAAGNRDYLGIECDIHVTKDGNFVVYHDDRTKYLCDRDLVLNDATLKEVRELKIKEPGGENFTESLVIPTLSEYLAVCKRYDKIAVVELKQPMIEKDVVAAVQICESELGLDQVIFISFYFENLLFVRKNYPSQRVQFLCNCFDDRLIEKLKINHFDIDIYYTALNEVNILKLRDVGLKINCWTCDDVHDAEKLIALDVDYITTNILL